MVEKCQVTHRPYTKQDSTKAMQLLANKTNNGSIQNLAAKPLSKLILKVL